MAWRVAIRVQLLIVACVLGVAAGWRLDSFDQLAVGGALELSLVVVLVVALATRGTASRGEAALDSWAATANTSFWTIPVATALAGPAGAVLAVLADRLAAVRSAWTTHLLRRDAPRPQRIHTAWIDQAPLGALIVGLALHVTGPAPSWTGTLTKIAGPLLAFTGATLFAASLSHAHQRQIRVTRSDTTRVLGLLAVRVACSVPLLVFWWDSPRGVVVALTAGSIPAFLPPQMALLYGYRSGIVRAAARVAWPLGAVGLVLALLAR